MKLGSTGIGVVVVTSIVVLLLFFLVIKAAYNVVENPSPTPTSPTTTSVLPLSTIKPSTTPIAQSGTSLKVWTGCSTASDCAIVRGICGPASVNIRYISEFEAYARERGKVVDCAPSKKIPAGVACEKNQCVLTDK